MTASDARRAYVLSKSTVKAIEKRETAKEKKYLKTTKDAEIKVKKAAKEE